MTPAHGPSRNRLQEAFNFPPEERKVIDMHLQDREGKIIIDCPVVVHNNVPESLHCLQILPDRRGEHLVQHEVLKDIFIRAGDTEVEVSIQDCAYIIDVLDGIFGAFVYAVFYDAELPERIG